MKKTQDYIDFALKAYPSAIDAMIALDIMYAGGDKRAGIASRKIQKALDGKAYK
jgi:hypothetical protein